MPSPIEIGLFSFGILKQASIILFIFFSFHTMVLHAKVHYPCKLGEDLGFFFISWYNQFS